MRFKSAVLGLAFLQRCGWLPFFFYKSKRMPIFCLMAGLLPALLGPTAVAQSSANLPIPIFQFGIFYNLDLEINPGFPFTVSGRVHCNTNIYCTGNSPGSPLIFSGSVDAAGTVSTNPSPLDPQNYGYRSGHVVFPAGSPMAHCDTLNLPLGISATNYTYAAIEGLLKMPPTVYALGTSAAYTTNGQRYFANTTDLIITNDAATGTNITVLYQNQYKGVGPSWLFRVAPDATNSCSTTNSYTYITNYITHIVTITTNKIVGYTNIFYSFVTNATFYDYRETNTVRALQIDVGRLDAWLSNTNLTTGGWQYELMNADSSHSTDKGHVINSIYVYNNIVPTVSQLPAVRLVNGAQLPTNTCGFYLASGLGIATAQPIYVEGNYNVTTDGVHFAYSLGSTTNNTLPACLIGDAVTLLSSNFVDNAAGGTENPAPSQTIITLNAACFEGIVPSNGSAYSGGLENFLRLLENWSGKTVTYNGSFVVMFPSAYATNHWGGSYYRAPTRCWGFDVNFLDVSKLPPLTPGVVDNTTNHPAITTQPQSQIVVQGSNVTFNVTAVGFSPLSYQWKFNGTNMPAATNTSLTLTNVNTNNAGNYTVVITNLYGSVTSSNAVLAVYATAAAMLNGCSFSCVNGFQFQVSGVPGFIYAVQESTNLTDWVSLITNTSPFIFMDANATNSPQQFYRTLHVP